MDLTTTRARIVDAFATRLRAIQRTGGYQTDAGLTLQIGSLAFGPDDDNLHMSIVIGDGKPTGSRQLKKKPRELPMQIAVGLRRWRPESWLTIEQAIGDVKRAIESGDDDTWGGLLMQAPEDGDEVALDMPVGTTSMGCAVVYIARYVETRGAP